MSTEKSKQEVIEGEIVEQLSKENELAVLEQEVQAAIASLPEVQKLEQARREINAASADFWKDIETKMVDNGIKSVKGNWGYVTIAERTDYKAEDLSAVPMKFITKVLDTKKVGAFAKLTGKPPKGVTKSTKLYLTKKIKAPVEAEE